MYSTNYRLRATVLASTMALTGIAAACNSNSKDPITDPTSTDANAGSIPPIVFGPAPAVFPAGAEMAVVQGDPSKAEPFTVRLRFPNGYKVAPHTHPTDENITVIQGAFRVGMGRTYDESQLTTLPAGGFVTAPALHEHFAKAVGTTVVQIHAIGPFALTYVNPADLPH